MPLPHYVSVCASILRELRKINRLLVTWHVVADSQLQPKIAYTQHFVHAFFAACAVAKDDFGRIPPEIIAAVNTLEYVERLVDENDDADLYTGVIVLRKTFDRFLAVCVPESPSIRI